MTKEEAEIIKKCPIIITGTRKFVNRLKAELNKVGFSIVRTIEETDNLIPEYHSGILIEFVDIDYTPSCALIEIPVIYAFDFFYGAGAIVLFPQDEKEWINSRNIRVWSAEYMTGYCAFWNIDGCDWLNSALQEIKENKTCNRALKTAVHMCARIAANIAVGKELKRFPKFYLAANQAECGE